MKLPRNESSGALIHKLSKLGYTQSRQTGSHIRLTRKDSGKNQHITLPNHNPIKVGTLSEILKEVAHQLEISKSDLIQKLYT